MPVRAVPTDPALRRACSSSPSSSPASANDSRLAREEIFGPVTASSAFDDYEAVLAEANDSEYGLAA